MAERETEAEKEQVQSTQSEGESQEESQSTDLRVNLEIAETKAKENWEALLRAKAELDNVRKRAAIDVEKAHKYVLERFARELLSVVDGFERGLETLDDEGMQLTYKLLLDVLDKFSVKMLDPLGETFDPAKHEALSMQENDSVKPNEVLQVVQKGFTIHERVLRPARVIVAKSP